MNREIEAKLIQASQKGFIAIVSALILKRSDVNAKRKHVRTALITAIQYRLTGLIEVLKVAGRMNVTSHITVNLEMK